MTERNARSSVTTRPAADSTPAVTLSDASAQWGDHVIWEHVNVAVFPGEFVAILGPNGVGKSTLVKVILGLFPLATGEVRVFGQPAGRGKGQVGYLPQRRSFDPGVRLRGIDLVRLGLDGDRWGVPLPGLGRWSKRGREDDARVRAVIELVGASSYAERPIGQVSGGEQQRLLIAQALVRNPSLLVLDEPLDSLDLPNQAAIAALVGRICREAGATILLVAHSVNPLISYLDRVIYLSKNGVASGTVQEVISSETLSRLYGAPVEVLYSADGHPVVVGQPEPEHGTAHAHLVR